MDLLIADSTEDFCAKLFPCQHAVFNVVGERTVQPAPIRPLSNYPEKNKYDTPYRHNYFERITIPNAFNAGDNFAFKFVFVQVARRGRLHRPREGEQRSKFTPGHIGRFSVILARHAPNPAFGEPTFRRSQDFGLRASYERLIFQLATELTYGVDIVDNLPDDLNRRACADVEGHIYSGRHPSTLSRPQR
ncbi:hypothetical protein ACQPZ2_07500 [Nocardia pseudovaccinii]|uniref:hypothetical protein n=1 Tax=Nocardia pseudovaccinii TaxID=189540 RepID=UPI003D8C93D0